MDLDTRHVIEVVLKQIKDTYNNSEACKNDKDLNDERKALNQSYFFHHMAVLSILLKYLSTKTLELYPDAKSVIDWAVQNYDNCVENKYIIPCSCDNCKQEVEPKVEPTTEKA